MNKLHLKHPAWLLLPAAAWLLLLVVTEILSDSQWGHGGHPSNGLMLYLTLLLSTPLFGVAGFMLMRFSTTDNRYNIRGIAQLANLTLVAFGFLILLLWFG